MYKCVTTAWPYFKVSALLEYRGTAGGEFENNSLI